MSVPDNFLYQWGVKKVPSATNAYKRLEEIFENYQQGIEIIHKNNNVPYIDYMLKKKGFLEFESNSVLRTVKVTLTEKSLEIYNHNILQVNEKTYKVL